VPRDATTRESMMRSRDASGMKIPHKCVRRARAAKRKALIARDVPEGGSMSTEFFEMRALIDIANAIGHS